MPKDERSRAPKAGPYSRPPRPMPAVGAMPKGQELFVGRGGQWAIGRVVRWFGEADDSDHWYEPDPPLTPKTPKAPREGPWGKLGFLCPAARTWHETRPHSINKLRRLEVPAATA